MDILIWSLCFVTRVQLYSKHHCCLKMKTVYIYVWRLLNPWSTCQIHSLRSQWIKCVFYVWVDVVLSCIWDIRVKTAVWVLHLTVIGTVSPFAVVLLLSPLHLYIYKALLHHCFNKMADTALEKTLTIYYSKRQKK